MANKTFHSSTVTFLDRTDERKLEVYISSNHPTVQIKNQNTGEYTPDWSTINLQLSADVFIDSQDVTTDSQTTINWYTKIGNTETLIGKGESLKISTNTLDTNPIITYVCKAAYQNVNALSQATFTRADTGLNGKDGAPAPAVQAQYSTDGATNWTATLNAATHKYIRYSYDGGKTWTTAIKMVGEDGTSVKIKGTATSKSTVSGTSYYTLVYNSTTITGAAIGDAYLLDGNMYVCVDSRDGNDYFMDVGHIQGPQGNDGQSSYVFIRYATDGNGANMVANPTSTTTHIGICTVNMNVAPATASSYTWSKFVGDSAKSIILSGTSQIFKVSSDATPIYTPTTIKVTAQVVNITVATWEYSVNGGINWTTTIPAGASLDTSTNTLTITGKDLTSNALVVRASNGIYKDVYTVSKVFDGATGATASMAFLTNENISFSANANGQVALTSFTTNVVAYNGTTKVTPTIGTISGLPSGMSVSAPVTSSNEQILTFSIANNSNLGSASSNNGTITIPITSPVSTNLKLSWSKINTGVTGVGIESTTVSYGVSDSSSSQPTDWQSTIPAVAEGKYLWTRTIIDYTDDNVPDTVTYIYAKQGEKGAIGNPGNSVTVSSIQYQEGTSATTAPTGTWSNAVVAVADGKYLWTKTAFSDGKVAYGVAKQGEKGNTGNAGRGVSSIVEQYYHSTSATSQTGGSWVTTAPTWVDGKYIWTRSVITYTDTTTYTTSPICVTGQKGGTGGTGTGVESVDIWYYQSTSATSLSGGSWSTTVPTWSDGKYVWTKTITTYTNNTTDETSAVCITGQKGATGVGIKSVTEHYLATSSSSGVTASTTGWTEAVQTITATNKYLWNYETITYTNNTTTTTAPVIIGVFGNTGNTGKGIKSVTEYYLATTASSGVTTSTAGWKNTIQTLTATNKYLWNYELITYTDDTTSTIAPVIIGVYGDKGDQGIQGPQGNDAYTVLLTNESHVFAGGISAAIASNATTQVLAYNGATSQSVTIVSVNGVAASTASTATGIAGLSFKCSALSGTTPTITFTCTTAFVSPNGTIPIVIKVGNISITKMFTYSIAFKGATGGVGAPSSSYWLVANADAVQKTTSGDILCTPATVTFTGKIQTGTSAPTDYAGRWIIAYTTDGTTYTDLYTSTANEASTSVAAGITYKALRARMYLAGGMTTLLDEQIIPFVSDGAIGVPGNDAVTFQVYSSNGYALSTNTPTVTLQTFAYIGDVAITSGATYQWYSYNNWWSAISGATLSYLDVSRTDVSFSKSYMCKMIFGGVEYTGVATIDDKNDTNKVFTSKPSNYTLGDLWIVGMDYIPNGVEVGTLLRTEHTNATYADSDWIAATKYDEKINALNSSVDKYDKYFSFDSQNGLKISARDANGNASQFSTTLSNERLSFNQGTDAVAYIESNKMKIKEAEIISPLTVTGQYSGSTMLQAPIINIGNFSIVVESNGSLSIIANT